MLEMVTKTFDKAAAYTNLVMLGGYAGAFTIWANTKTFLSKEANIWIALLLGSSLSVFVLYEVYKGAVQSNSMSKADVLIKAKSNPEEFFRRVQEYEKKTMIAVQRQRSIWMVVFSVAVLTGLLAIGLLFYNYFALLIGWSSWPNEIPSHN
jgi:hypothetical protein